MVDDINCCDTCKNVNKQLKKNVKTKARTSPAKSKAPLSACGAEKLRATVVATRLQCKMLQEKLDVLQAKMQIKECALINHLKKILCT